MIYPFVVFRSVLLGERWRTWKKGIGRKSGKPKFKQPWARSIQPNFPEFSVQNSMDRFGPTGKVSKKRVHLLRWSSFPGRTGWNFG